MAPIGTPPGVMVTRAPFSKAIKALIRTGESLIMAGRGVRCDGAERSVEPGVARHARLPLPDKREISKGFAEVTMPLKGSFASWNKTHGWEPVDIRGPCENTWKSTLKCQRPRALPLLAHARENLLHTNGRPNGPGWLPLLVPWARRAKSRIAGRSSALISGRDNTPGTLRGGRGKRRQGRFQPGLAQGINEGISRSLRFAGIDQCLHACRAREPVKILPHLGPTMIEEIQRLLHGPDCDCPIVPKLTRDGMEKR